MYSYMILVAMSRIAKVRISAARRTPPFILYVYSSFWSLVPSYFVNDWIGSPVAATSYLPTSVMDQSR